MPEDEAVPTGPPAAARPGIFKRVCSTILVTVLLFVAVEGLSSLVMSAYDLRHWAPVAPYSEHDSLLGWISKPGVNLRDLWGPGRSLYTNEHRIRSKVAHRQPVGPDEVGVVCSGDSFAFGEGVDNEQTWCHHLSLLEPSLVTFNLGQPGYGLDQAFLRYRRDGRAIDHSLHLFTFITDDFARMASAERFQVAKPLLRLVEGELVVDNLPLPRVGPTIRRWTTRLGQDLRFVELGQRAMSRLPWSRSQVEGDVDTELLESVATQVFREVRQVTRDRGGVAVFVYLPTLRDLESREEWRDRAHAALDQPGSFLIDLTEPLLEVPLSQVRELFIPEHMPAGGHYSSAGNQWIAARLLERLLEIEAVSSLLNTDEPS